MSESMRAFDSGVAFAAQSSCGRQVGSGAEIMTSFPFACGNHFTNSVLSLKRGRVIVSNVTSLPPVPGLYPTIWPCSVRTLGATRSMCDGPRSHPRQVPYCSSFASTPHDL